MATVEDAYRIMREGSDLDDKKNKQVIKTIFFEQLAHSQDYRTIIGSTK